MKRHRRLLIACVAIIIAASIGGCAHAPVLQGTPALQNATAPQGSPAHALTPQAFFALPGQSVIAPVALTADQEDIIELLSIEREMLLFEYRLEGVCENIEFWLEAYEYGKLANTVPKLSISPEAGHSYGRFAAVLEQGGALGCSFSLQSGGASYSMPSVEIGFDASVAGRGRAASSIREPIAISPGKEIALYYSLYMDDNGQIRAYELERFAEEPAELAAYPRAYLLKCKFNVG